MDPTSALQGPHMDPSSPLIDPYDSLSPILRFPLKIQYRKYSQTSLIRTPKGQNQVSALQRCPHYRSGECMSFGISGTKRTVRKERLDCKTNEKYWHSWEDKMTPKSQGLWMRKRSKPLLQGDLLFRTWSGRPSDEVARGRPLSRAILNPTKDFLESLVWKGLLC